MNSKNPRTDATFFPENGTRGGSPCFLLCISMRILLLVEVRVAQDDLPEYYRICSSIFTAAVDLLDSQFLVETCLSGLPPALDSVAIDRVQAVTRLHLAR